MSAWKLKFAENFKYLICNNFQILLHFSTLRKPFEEAHAFLCRLIWHSLSLHWQEAVSATPERGKNKSEVRKVL
jgi:lipopolysaccharide biosynthesis glycosyltransferase